MDGQHAANDRRVGRFGPGDQAQPGPETLGSQGGNQQCRADPAIKAPGADAVGHDGEAVGAVRRRKGLERAKLAEPLVQHHRDLRRPGRPCRVRPGLHSRGCSRGRREGGWRRGWGRYLPAMSLLVVPFGMQQKRALIGGFRMQHEIPGRRETKARQKARRLAGNDVVERRAHPLGHGVRIRGHIPGSVEQRRCRDLRRSRVLRPARRVERTELQARRRPEIAHGGSRAAAQRARNCLHRRADRGRHTPYRGTQQSVSLRHRRKQGLLDVLALHMGRVQFHSGVLLDGSQMGGRCSQVGIGVAKFRPQALGASLGVAGFARGGIEPGRRRRQVALRSLQPSPHVHGFGLQRCHQLRRRRQLAAQ